jgi:hypothetical protein
MTVITIFIARGDGDYNGRRDVSDDQKYLNVSIMHSRMNSTQGDCGSDRGPDFLGAQLRIQRHVHRNGQSIKQDIVFQREYNARVQAAFTAVN